MKKINLKRFAGMICLCLVSSLIKSEDKNCSTHCILSTTAVGKPKQIAAVPAKENTDILTYYGYYSKY